MDPAIALLAISIPSPLLNEFAEIVTLTALQFTYSTSTVSTSLQKKYNFVMKLQN
jgi:hypothetical protein